jgi:hypothetical protein
VESTPPGPRTIAIVAGATFVLAVLALVVTQAGALLLAYPGLGLTAAAGMVGMTAQPSIERVVALAVGVLGTVALAAFAGLLLIFAGYGPTSRADDVVTAVLALVGAGVVAAASAYVWRWAGRREARPVTSRHALLAPAAGVWAAAVLAAVLSG